ncbi:MAG: hypothetical protein ABUL50_09520, partial [Rhizobacter sp.]
DLHAGMLQGLLDADVVADARLRALAVQRGDAIRGGLVKLGMGAERIRVEEPQATDSKDGTIAANLSMVAGNAKRPSTAASAPPLPAPAASAALPAK